MKSQKFKTSFNVSREKLELFYSVFLLIVIPVMLAINTLLIVNSVSSDFDTELQRKADLANEIFGNSVKNNLDDTESIQSTINTVVESREEVTDIKVVVPDDGELVVIAAWDQGLVDKTVNDLQYTLVEQEEQSIAELVQTTDDRVWEIVTPIYENGELVAITAMNVSLAEADALVASTLQTSLFIMLITIVIVVLLLWNHFRFVEYAQLFRKLKEADQLKSDFLSVATHELKAPMSAIKGYVSNVLDGTFGDVNEKVKENLEVVQRQADRLNGLVQDLLNVSRIEEGRIEYKIEDFDVADIIGPIVDRYKDRAKDKHIEIIYEKPPANSKIKADSGRYEEIMTNLIDNAVKYSTGGTVTISHKIEDKIIKTSVRDTGIGMSAEERDRLFSRFYRVKNEKTRDIAGTGLGLWIIKQYAENMGGQIYVDSLEGVGTEFTVDLPRA